MQGGADVTVQVLCTIGLIVVPSNGAKTQWVEGVRCMLVHSSLLCIGNK